jgi:hypothetical protein
MSIARELHLYEAISVNINKPYVFSEKKSFKGLPMERITFIIQI